MIKQPTVVRDRVLADVVYMLKHLYTMLTFLPETEVDVLLQLEQPQSYELAVELTNVLMAKFGHQTAPKEPRFDKTHRAMAKHKPKPLRGSNTFANSKERKRRGAPELTNAIPTVMEAE